MTTLLLFLGLLLVVIGALMLLVAAFRVSIWWGIASLLIPFAQLIFVFVHWSESKSAIVTQTMGLLLVLAAVLVGGNAFTAEYQQQFNRYMQKIVPAQSQPAAVQPSAEFAQDSDISATQQESAVVPATGVKTIYKCVDANGRVAYTEQPCVGKQEKAIVIKEDIDESSLDKTADDVLDKMKEIVTPDSESAD